jgi:thiamine monophosphate synthase
MDVRPWPPLLDEDRWLAELMDRRLRESTQSPEELVARARELRAQAEKSDVKGIVDASLALADRYEQASSARLSA